MTGDWLFILALLAAIGAALVAGVFFAFSSFVMPALAQLAPAAGIAAMQSINVVVLRSVFMPVFLGTALLSAVIALSSRGNMLLLSGGLLYLLGCFGVTALRNVPLNHRLARAEPESDAGAALWAHYLRRWVQWNHIRTMAATMSAILLALSGR
jgi:uncharacterized membrane protein